MIEKEEEGGDGEEPYGQSNRKLETLLVRSAAVNINTGSLLIHDV